MRTVPEDIPFQEKQLESGCYGMEISRMAVKRHSGLSLPLFWNGDIIGTTAAAVYIETGKRNRL